MENPKTSLKHKWNYGEGKPQHKVPREPTLIWIRPLIVRVSFTVVFFMFFLQNPRFQGRRCISRTLLRFRLEILVDALISIGFYGVSPGTPGGEPACCLDVPCSALQCHSMCKWSPRWLSSASLVPRGASMVSRCASCCLAGASRCLAGASRCLAGASR